tara:strand:- start:122 stop:595 length:474 start_codon:yes stop_codon:yes gene_type:complete
MNLSKSKKQFSDKLSICLSVCCILHCIALPFLILLIPGVASLWINDESVHVVLVLLAIPISLFAMSVSLRKHDNYKCIALAVIGLALLVLAIFMHDIGFSGEHGHVEHANEEHGDGEHGQEEHGGLGETLETVFTVLGGLILLSGHFLNIRLTNKAI